MLWQNEQGSSVKSLNLVDSTGYTLWCAGKHGKLFSGHLPFSNCRVECPSRPCRIGMIFEKSNNKDLSPLF